MSGFTVKQSRFRKVQGSVQTESASDQSETVEAIIQVNEAGYVPEGVNVRSRIDPHMITAETRTENLEKLEVDPKVDSVSVSRKLRTFE